MTVPPPTLPQQVLAGNRRALAKALTQVENQTALGKSLLAELYPHSQKAHRIGITGAPGSGKSTLTAAITKHFRQQGKQIAVLAVDPSSPFSGGAILGDRIRMGELYGDEGVFIRSMASRGNLGGLAWNALDMTVTLAAAGFDCIVIETVGAGQSEVEIASVADTVLVVEAPGLGDEVQAIKAGILEIADILVVNKADQPQAAATYQALQSLLMLNQQSQANLHPTHAPAQSRQHLPVRNQGGWEVCLLKTVALRNEGIAELCEKIANHADYLKQSGSGFMRQRQAVEHQLSSVLKEELYRKFRQKISDEHWENTIVQIADYKLDVRSAASAFLPPE
ncbi:MAG TPA: methylmalonyl Co-A mutase-associated GTPase MeaB [Anaerolineales bacterium]|nr:methylmalonyl Co-A mutase-associated GTPase MeaB [Anaerolineales bacterium]